MGRPREFQDEQALDAAVDCFWQRGLEATSVRDLSAEMGMTLSSLYNAFGDKRALFAVALERYADLTLRQRIARIERDHSGKAAIWAFFTDLVARSRSDPDRRGCFIVNSAMEVGPHDDELQARVSGYLSEFEQFFRRCLDAGIAHGEIPDTIAPDDVARHLLAVGLGVRVLARVCADRSVLESIVRTALAPLDPPAPAVTTADARPDPALRLKEGDPTC